MPRRDEYRGRVFRWGDWAQARSIFTGLAFKLSVAAEAGLWAEAQAAAARIKHNIYGQNYPHVPLSDWQSSAKARDGKDPRILIEDGDYVKAIRAIHLGRGSYGVGIAAGDEENAGKGVMHEWGGVNNLGHYVPARPHYRVELERIRASGLVALRQHIAGVLDGKDFLSSKDGRMIGVNSVEELQD